MPSVGQSSAPSALNLSTVLARRARGGAAGLPCAHLEPRERPCVGGAGGPRGHRQRGVLEPHQPVHARVGVRRQDRPHLARARRARPATRPPIRPRGAVAPRLGCWLHPPLLLPLVAPADQADVRPLYHPTRARRSCRPPTPEAEQWEYSSPWRGGREEGAWLSAGAGTDMPGSCNLVPWGVARGLSGPLLRRQPSPSPPQRPAVAHGHGLPRTSPGP